MNARPRIAVVGATGVVGREVLGALEQVDYPPEQVVALASERSEGTEVDLGDETLEVERATADSFRGVALALFATPADVSRTLTVAAQAAGAWAVDASSAFLMDAQVPLVLPALNLAALKAPFRGRIVRCPSPVTTALVTALAPLRRAFGVRQVVITALLGASSLGEAGVRELEAQTAALLSGRAPDESLFPHRLAFNLVPHVGEVQPSGLWTFEEEVWRVETQRLWNGPEGTPAVSGTAILVPTFFGYGLSLAVKLGASPTLEAVRAALQEAPGVKLLDALAERVYPMPMLVTADPAVHLGRLRLLSDDPQTLLLFATIDNAGRGAALNLVEVGQALLERA